MVKLFEVLKLPFLLRRPDLRKPRLQGLHSRYFASEYSLTRRPGHFRPEKGKGRGPGPKNQPGTPSPATRPGPGLFDLVESVFTVRLSAACALSCLLPSPRCDPEAKGCRQVPPRPESPLAWCALQGEDRGAVSAVTETLFSVTWFAF